MSTGMTAAKTHRFPTLFGRPSKKKRTDVHSRMKYIPENFFYPEDDMDGADDQEALDMNGKLRRISCFLWRGSVRKRAFLSDIS
jgi:hypothetical protein